jgi:hypothetical protein
MQLLDLHEKGHPASSGAARPFRAALWRGELTTYRFNTETAQHTFCRQCGIHAFYVPRSDPDQVSVNARCLDDIDVSALKPSRFFDGRNWEAAFAARQASGS